MISLLLLAGSILLTSYLTLSFKLAERLGISTFQAIVFNYITCVITGALVDGRFPLRPALLSEPWLPWAGLMGVTFISLFNVIAWSAQRMGVAVTSVANKLSLVIPFLFSVYLYHEATSWMKIAGVLLALAAVWLTCLPGRQPAGKTAGNHHITVPLLIFVASGLLDTMIKYVEQAYVNDLNQNTYLITAFAAAAITGSILLSLLVVTGRQSISWKAILAGICIGIPNYFSIWCLLKVLKQYANNSSAIIPVNNMGIVLFSAIMAAWLFNEKLSGINRLGILLSLAAIALIAYG